ncbi:hypothetical protein AwDysgo_21280 [Bacteroidales bacterium]|nr:hypothetical protein AwDysgo_21280 [Bacteroidales bacterium]
MKHFYVFIALCLFASCASFNIDDELSFAQVDPFMKILPESSFFSPYNSPPVVAAGEHATFQFAIRSGKQIEGLSTSVSSWENADGAKLTDTKIGYVGYVRVGRQTPDRAKDASTSLSLFYPDPIIEKASCDIKRDVSQSIWITVAVPHDAKPGDYIGQVKLSGTIAGHSFEIQEEMKLKVYPVVLETPSLWVTNWVFTSPEKMKIFNGGVDVEPYSDKYWELIGELAQKMKDCYQNVVMISPLEHVVFNENKGIYSFDYTQFDKMVRLLKDAGVLKMIEGGHIATREGDWGSQFATFVPEMIDGKKELKLHKMSSDTAKSFYSQFIPNLVQHLKENKWFDSYSQHIADEPISSNITTYIEIANFVKSLAPDIKIIEACHSHDLENTLDIWVPQLNFYKDGYDFYTERQKKGDQVWFYTCLAPQGDYANRFIEQALIKTRLIHWINYRYGATGYLHWGFNYWPTGDPYYETTSSNIESGNVLPGGDSWIVYPDNGKLYGSVRLDAMRDGIADYTLLQMLERKNPELAKELCRQVVFHWTLYDTEGDHFRLIRSQILEALSE